MTALAYEDEPPARPLTAVPDDDRRGPNTPSAELPDPTAWLDRLLRVAAECLDGRRQAAQLGRYATFDVVRRLAAAARRTPGEPSRLVSLRLTEPADGVVEGCAVLARPDRHAALAVRLEGMDGRWVCVALDLV